MICSRLRRVDLLTLVGEPEPPQYLPSHSDQRIAARRYLRVLLRSDEAPAGASTPSAPPITWNVQVSHIRVGGRQGPSYLGGNAFHRKLRLLAGSLTQGFAKAAGASTPSAQGPTITVTLGDQNLSMAEIRDSTLFKSLVAQPFDLVACAGS